MKQHELPVSIDEIKIEKNILVVSFTPLTMTHTVHSYFISLSKWYHSDKVNM